MEIVNRIEAAVHIWLQKDDKKKSTKMKAKRSSWGGKVKGLVSDTEKNHLLIQRGETLLRCLMRHFPGLPQTALDMNKIQFNKVLFSGLSSLSIKSKYIYYTQHGIM